MPRLLRSLGLAWVLGILVCVPAAAQDLALKDLIDEALKNNPDIRVAEARAASADQRITQEGSLADPMFSAGYQNEGFKKYTYGDSQYAWWMFSLSQTFPFPGKRSLQREAAQYEAESARAASESMRRDVVGRVSQAYYDLVLATKELDIIAARQPLAARLEDAALARYGAGTGFQEDVIMAQAEKYMLMENEAMAKSRRDSAEAMLKRETGNTSVNPLARPVIAPSTPFNYSLDELVQRALAFASELTERQQMILASEKRLSRAKKEAWPDITIMPQYFRLGGGMEDMWALTASVPLPLFYKQKQGAAITESSWNLVGAEKELEATRVKITSEIRDNLAMVTSAQRVMELYKNALIPKARQNIDAALALFASGRINASQALASLKAPYDYELSLWQQQVQREKAIARIKVYTGDMEAQP
jgi:outer membrane protein, heavy metal efflux system